MLNNPYFAQAYSNVMSNNKSDPSIRDPQAILAGLSAASAEGVRRSNENYAKADTTTPQENRVSAYEDRVNQLSGNRVDLLSKTAEATDKQAKATSDTAVAQFMSRPEGVSTLMGVKSPTATSNPKQDLLPTTQQNNIAKPNMLTPDIVSAHAPSPNVVPDDREEFLKTQDIIEALKRTKDEKPKWLNGFGDGSSNSTLSIYQR
jgi:hypothetical protein